MHLEVLLGVRVLTSLFAVLVIREVLTLLILLGDPVIFPHLGHVHELVIPGTFHTTAGFNLFQQLI